MYWGQVAVGVAVAIGVAHTLNSTGRPTAVVLASAAVAYVVVRWLLAWVYRTRFWVRQSGRGHRLQCPNCHAQRYRVGGDWILRCKQCSWTEGWPVVRWVTRSVPARQLRRTVVGPKLLVVVLAVAVIATGGVGAISVPDEFVTDPVPDTTGQSASTPTPPESSSLSFETPTPTETSEASTSSESDALDLTKAEELVLERTNQVRQHRDLDSLSRDSCLDQYALQHSQDMAEYGYSIRHGGPDGGSWRDRLAEISGDCGRPISENIHKGPAGIETYIYGTSETIRLSSPSNLAEYAVRSWMNSAGHRKNMLDAGWSRVGIGVATNGEDLYFTIMFS